MKRVIILTLSGLTLLILIISVKSCGGKGSIKVTAENPQKRNITETVSANGKIQPEVEVKITSDVSGEITEMFVKEGDRVKKGDLLCRIKPDIYESALERVNASVNTSKAGLEASIAQLEQAKSNMVNMDALFQRNKKLFEQNAISQQEFDAAKAQYESAKAQVKTAEENVRSAKFNITGAEASLKEASSNLSKTQIYAPVDGTVSKLNVEKGERVQGVSGFQGTEIMRLANLNEMEVSVEVNENDIIRVHLNDTSLIEVDAYKDRVFKGIVTEIANSANTLGLTADQVTNFTVKIRILQSSYQDLFSETNAPFRPGMSATVEIQTKRVSNVLSVPIQCVTTRADSTKKKIEEKMKGNQEGDLVVTNLNEKNEKGEKEKIQEYVFVIGADDKAEMKPVKTGIQDNNYIQITEGLQESDLVISGPYGAISKKLKKGSRIEKVEPDQLFKSEKDSN